MDRSRLVWYMPKWRCLSLNSVAAPQNSNKDDKRDFLGTSKQESVVIDCVVPDSFEDDHCSNDDVKKNSSHCSAVVSCKMPVYEVRSSYETHPQCATNAKEKYMKRKSSLHSWIYDVKRNNTMVYLVDCKGFGETWKIMTKFSLKMPHVLPLSLR